VPHVSPVIPMAQAQLKVRQPVSLCDALIMDSPRAGCRRCRQAKCRQIVKRQCSNELGIL
jgi:hypothetical protein